MMAILLDPKLFNYLVVILYALAMVRWGFQRDWIQCAYWFFCTGMLVMFNMMVGAK